MTIGTYVTEYRLYEVTNHCRKGIVIRDYKSYDRAIKAMNKSIFRFIKPIKVLNG